MFMALKNDVYGNSLFTCLSVPPPAFFKAIKLLQSNITGSNSLKDSCVLQSLVKYAAQAERRESIRRWRKRQDISVVPQGCWSLPGDGDCNRAPQSIGFGTGLTQEEKELPSPWEQLGQSRAALHQGAWGGQRQLNVSYSRLLGERKGNCRDCSRKGKSKDKLKALPWCLVINIGEERAEGSLPESKGDWQKPVGNWASYLLCSQNNLLDFYWTSP